MWFVPSQLTSRSIKSMSFRKLLAAALTFSAVLSMSFVANTANAQSTTAGTCSDINYLGPIVNVNNLFGTLDFTKPDAVGQILVSAITLRTQYEDTTPPAGCEATR